MMPLPYRGRFAPSPTGPLHFGSLVAALGSFLDARAAGGEWLLRMEDVDGPRCSMAAAEAILHALEVFGFSWDGPLVWQSQREAAYAAALDQLRGNGDVFSCACTRRELAVSAQRLGVDGVGIYPGTCRTGALPGRRARAWRVRVDGARIAFNDRLHGVIESDLAQEVGDFVLRRADGVFAYQLAVVVDDAEAGITHVVRGADLLSSTPRQIYLQQRLGLPVPVYAHLPLAKNSAGEKLSKQTRAPALDLRSPLPQLLAALEFLGVVQADRARPGTLAEFWPWAIAAWRQ